MKVVLLKTVKDFRRRVYREGAVVEVRFAGDGVPHVVGAAWLGLNPGEWRCLWEGEE